LGDLAEGEVELVHKRRVRARLLDRGQVLAGHVLDEREHERLAVRYVADHCRHRSEARLLRGTPAPLAGDQLVAAFGAWTHNDGLEHPLRLERVGETRR